MAGYKPERTLYKLNFSQTEHAGLEVTTRSISVDGLKAIIELAGAFDGLDAEHARAEDLAKVDELFVRFAAVLVGWNVIGDDDQPVPATREGLGTQDFPFVMAVILAWIQEMSQAPPPLPRPASSGAMSQEASLALAASSIPMEPTASQASSPGHG
jgi:hypothetical protein